MAGRIYSNDFKVQAVKRVIEDGLSSAQVARELGININTLREWVKRYKENQDGLLLGAEIFVQKQETFENSKKG